MFNKLLDERIDEIQQMNDGNNFNDLTDHFTSPIIAPNNFVKFTGSAHLYNDINRCNISIEKSDMIK